MAQQTCNLFWYFYIAIKSFPDFFLDKFRNSSQVSHVVTGTYEQHGHFGVAAAIPTIIYWSL